MEPSCRRTSKPDRWWSVGWKFGRADDGADSPDPHSPENDRHWQLATIEYDSRPHLNDATLFRIIHLQTKEKKRLTPEEFATFGGGRLYAIENAHRQPQVNETTVSDDEQEITDFGFRWFFSCFQCI